MTQVANLYSDMKTKEPFLCNALLLFVIFFINIHYLLLLGLGCLANAVLLDNAREVANCLCLFYI